jgi:flagellar export protein FliJ
VKKFRFPPDCLLALRRLQQEIEQARMEELAQTLGRMNRRKEQLHEARRCAEADVRLQMTPGEEVGLPAAGSLVPYLRRLGRAGRQLESEGAQLLARIGEQRQRLVEARQRREILEKFRAKALDQWRREADREQESLAGELFLAKWKKKISSPEPFPAKLPRD